MEISKNEIIVPVKLTEILATKSYAAKFLNNLSTGYKRLSGQHKKQTTRKTRTKSIAYSPKQQKNIKTI